MRPYRMRRRAQHIEGTRQRIIEAAARLHTTIGPANTSIAGIAHAAGVTRLTVYRHFPDIEDLFVACKTHWSATHPRPDIEAWRRVPDLERRSRRAFRDLYAWYAEHGPSLLPIHRDIEAMPAGAQAGMRAELEALADALIGDVAGVGSRGKRARATAAHLLSLPTWHSLAVDQGLGTAAAASLATELLLAVATDSGRRR